MENAKKIKKSKNTPSLNRHYSMSRKAFFEFLSPKDGPNHDTFGDVDGIFMSTANFSAAWVKN